MSNPLVAQRQDSTTWHSGINVLDDAAGVYDGVRSGSWIEGGIAALGTGLDLLTMAMNPVGTLISYGLNWLIEHVKPLQDALNKLAGDADQIAAYSETWANVGKAVQQAAKDLVTTVEQDTANWSGPAADAYRANLKNKIDHVNAASTCANTISTVVKIVGVITGAVRAMVRDMVTQAIGDFVQDALEEVCSLGLGTPVVVAQVVEQVSAWMEKIGALIKKLINSVEALRPMMSKLEEIFTAIKKVMSELHGRPGEGSTHVSAADDVPTSHEPTASTHEPPPGDDTPSMKDHEGDPKTDSREDGCVPGSGDPVDLATGQMFMTQTDAEFPGVLPLVIERTHFSSYRVGRFFGPSWTSTVDQRIEVEDDAVYFADAPGVRLRYPVPAVDAPTMPAEGPRWPLSVDEDGGYVITQPGRFLRFPAGTGPRPILAITDRNGNRVEFDYDDTGMPAGIRHSGGYHIGVRVEDRRIGELFLHNTENEPISLVRYSYDAAGRLSDVVNSSGAAFRFDYDAEGRVTRWADRNGEWYGYDYDDAGRVVRSAGSGGALTGRWDYDPENRVTVYTNSLGHATTYHFNEFHQVVRQIDALGQETTQEWNRHDRLLARTDPLGRTTRYTYDESGNQTGVTRPDGATSACEYDVFGSPLTVIDPDGGRWQHEYDDRGNLTAVTDPSGATTWTAYDDTGAPREVTDAMGNTRSFRNNAAGLPAEVTDPAGGTTSYGYDAFGRVTTITDALGGVAKFGWTVEGKPAWRTTPDGATERWRFDAEGNHFEHVDAQGRVTRTETTHFGRPQAQTAPDGTRIEFRYDTEMRLSEVVNPAGLSWRYERDAVGNLVRETDFNGRETHYSYDAAGQLVRRVNGTGQVVERRFDALGNVLEQRSGDGATSRFEYDPMNRITRAANDDCEVVFERDALGRVLAETVDGRTVRSAYDAAGRKIHRTSATGAATDWEFDLCGRPKLLTTGGRTVSFGYDAAGHEIERLLDSGTMLVQSWDAAHRLASQTVSQMHQAADAGAATADRVQHRRYHYGADGFVRAVDDLLSGGRRYDVGRTGRITAVHGPHTAERYDYDTMGNLAFAHVSGDPRPERWSFDGTLVRQAGPNRYVHDGQGRVVLRQHKRLSAKPDNWHFTWDAEDRLVAVTTPDGTRWRYRYDAFGRRIAKQRLTPTGHTVAAQTDFVWDGTTLIEQIENGERGTRWEWLPGTNRAVAQTELGRAENASQEWVDREFYAIVTDVVGTPSELVDSSGDVVWRAQTTLWGEALGGPARTPLRFPGQYHDPETGLHYNLFRFYDPSAARYLSPDPLGLSPSPNHHAYVPNPVHWADPFGLAGTCAQHDVEGLPRSRDQITDGPGDCKEVADQIRDNLGAGEVHHITPQAPYPQLGPYQGQPTSWSHHYAVVHEGRVYDAFTPRNGLPIDEYKARFEYNDAIDFGF